MQVLAIQLSNIARADFSFLLEQISKEDRDRINRFVHAEDAHRTLIANILIRNILCDRLSVCNRELSFDRNTFGKPFLASHPNIHYNLSHSGDWIICAIDDSPIGVDVEKIQSVELDIAEQFFSSMECKDLFDKPANQRLVYFYDLWTLKESYIKAVGKGLSIPLNSFAIRILDNDIQLYVEGVRSYDYYFRKYRLREGYQTALCAGKNGFSEQVEFLIWDDLLENFVINCT